jgi:hypothetical protein
LQSQKCHTHKSNNDFLAQTLKARQGHVLKELFFALFSRDTYS